MFLKHITQIIVQRSTSKMPLSRFFLFCLLVGFARSEFAVYTLTLGDPNQISIFAGGDGNSSIVYVKSVASGGSGNSSGTLSFIIILSDTI